MTKVVILTAYFLTLINKKAITRNRKLSAKNPVITELKNTPF